VYWQQLHVSLTTRLIVGSRLSDSTEKSLRTSAHDGMLAPVKTAPLALVLLCLAAEPGHSATLELTVKDARESAIGDAVVWVVPK
jgi:hypothetical protein